MWCKIPFNEKLASKFAVVGFVVVVVVFIVTWILGNVLPVIFKRVKTHLCGSWAHLPPIHGDTLEPINHETQAEWPEKVFSFHQHCQNGNIKACLVSFCDYIGRPRLPKKTQQKCRIENILQNLI